MRIVVQPDSLHCTQQLGHHVLTLQALPCVPQLLPEGLHRTGGFSTLQQKVLKALTCSIEHTFWAESQHAAKLKCQRQHPPHLTQIGVLPPRSKGVHVCILMLSKAKICAHRRHKLQKLAAAEYITPSMASL